MVLLQNSAQLTGAFSLDGFEPRAPLAVMPFWDAWAVGKNGAVSSKDLLVLDAGRDLGKSAPFVPKKPERRDAYVTPDENPAIPVRLVAQPDLCLPEPAMLALKAAHASDFDIRLVSGQVNGRPVTVVVMGESHYKGQVDAGLGKAVLDQFYLRGLEGANTAKRWGGLFFESSLHLVRPIIWLVTMGHCSSGSTIQEASRENFSPALLAHLKAACEKKVCEAGLRNLDEQQLQKKRYRFRLSGPGLPSKEITMNGIQLLAFIDSEQEASALTMALDLKEHDNIPLEKGHIPDLAENVASIYHPVMLLVFGAMFLRPVLDHFAPGLIPPQMASAHDLFNTVFLTYFWSGTLLARYFPPNSLIRVLLNPVNGFDRARNHTMVANTIKALQDHPDQDMILDIVGKAHVAGMVDFLKSEYGFETVDLPELPAKKGRGLFWSIFQPVFRDLWAKMRKPESPATPTKE